MTYRFLTPAVDEVAEAAKYYEAQAKGLGAKFFDELEAAILRILQFPEAWSLLSKPFRHCSLRCFPYSIIYSVSSPREILIVSVFHLHREPMSWARNV
jgi:toxin ParE2